MPPLHSVSYPNPQKTPLITAPGLAQQGSQICATRWAQRGLGVENGREPWEEEWQLEDS